MAEVIARYKGGDLIAAVALVECLCAKLQDARDEIERLKRAAPGPATEEMLEWARGLIEEVRDGCGPVAGVRVFGKLKVFVRVTDVP